jgi:hypothetical protein
VFAIPVQRGLRAGALAGALGAGCGSSRARPAQTRTAFITSANAVCSFEQYKLTRIGLRAAARAQALGAPAVIRQQVAQVQLATERLRRLARPPGDAGAIERWLTARAVAATVALDLSEAPASGQAAAVRDVRAELARVRARARALAAGYGARTCGETD